jgi:hypothetical protein
VAEVDVALDSLWPVLNRQFLGLEWTTILERIGEARTIHVQRLRAELAAAYPAVLDRLERIVALASTATIEGLRPHRLHDVPAAAKFLGARYLVWHPDTAYGEPRHAGRRPLNRTRLTALNLLRSTDRDTFADYRERPLEAQLACERCGALGELWIATPSREGGSGFRCPHCGHVDGIERTGSRAWCSCEPCRSERDRFRLHFQRELWSLASAALERHLGAQVAQSGAHRIAPPTETEMKRDWLMHRSALTRVEAEVLSMQPSTVDELLALADELDTVRRRQGRRRSIRRPELVNRLLEHRVIYRAHVNEESTARPPESWLTIYFAREMRATARGADGRTVLRSFGDLSLTLGREPGRVLECGDDREFWSGLERPFSIQGAYIVDRTDKAKGEQDPWPTISIEWSASLWRLSEPWLRTRDSFAPKAKETLLLNPFAVALGHHATARSIAVDRVVPDARAQVIASPAEACLLPQLTARFPGHLVVPQLPLITAIRFDLLAPHLPAEAVAYLKWCRVDFGVVDSETYELMHVVEVQAGGHHDTADRERKDRWKREACALAGIEFEEVM